MWNPVIWRKVAWLIATAIVATAVYVSTALATAGDGFTGTTLALGRFVDDVDVNNIQVSQPTDRDNIQATDNAADVWQSLQKTHGPSDLYVQSNVWVAGGRTGWHSHPGHSLITVTSGELTVYEGDDPDCTPHVYTHGMGFVDPGGSHVHIIRKRDRDTGDHDHGAARSSGQHAA